jgi:hypothetical protein
MVNIIVTYQEYKNEIEKFILDNIYNNGVVSLEHDSFEAFVKTFKSLQLLYLVNEDHHQSSPSFFKTSSDKNRLGTNRSAAFKNKKFNENGEYISSPYICSVSGNTIITVIKKVDINYIIMDFNLVTLLEELGYISHFNLFTQSNKFIYGIIGYGLSMLSIILILYSFISLATYFFYETPIIEIVFKSIISLTLGLAIFDLGKNLLEHEVVYKDSNIHKNNDNKIFIKFLISIITALSIEALMLVLKISLTKDYSDMIHAVFLISGVSLMIASLALFYKFSDNTRKNIPL